MEKEYVHLLRPFKQTLSKPAWCSVRSFSNVQTEVSALCWLSNQEISLIWSKSSEKLLNGAKYTLDLDCKSAKNLDGENSS